MSGEVDEVKDVDEFLQRNDELVGFQLNGLSGKFSFC